MYHKNASKDNSLWSIREYCSVTYILFQLCLLMERIKEKNICYLLSKEIKEIKGIKSQLRAFYSFIYKNSFFCTCFFNSNNINTTRKH